MIKPCWNELSMLKRDCQRWNNDDIDDADDKKGRWKIILKINVMIKLMLNTNRGKLSK